jgi:ubiquinone/menaquinone biosynthesis C-methylase UbiE
MTDAAARYDRIAAGYERWWAPVLAPSAVALLDRLDAPIAAGARHLLDVGVGTGNLAIAALRRWPAVRVTGVDASSEMIGAVEALVGERLVTAEHDRFDGRVALADELPFPDGSLDAAMSSFVLQLVPSRSRALREIRRVLRPGGMLAYVTWMGEDRIFAPDRVFDALLAEAGFEDEEAGDGRVGDVPSVERAIGELRRAGFRNVEAEAGELVYAFTIDSYLGFLREFDAESTFDEMPRDERRRFVTTLRDRLAALPPDALTFRAGIVYATGIRSDG